MVLNTWGDVIVASLQQVWATVLQFLPRLLGALVVFVAGWIVAVALGKVVEHVIRALRIDSVLEKLEFHKPLDRAGIRLNSAAFLGGLVKWFLIVVFLLAAVNILNLAAVGQFLNDVLLYLPRVIVAALILVIAALVAETAERVVRGGVESAGMRGGLVGAVTRWSIWVFAIVAVLLQLGIASALIQTVVTGLVAMIAIAGGIAFGLGGKEHASDVISKVRREISHR